MRSRKPSPESIATEHLDQQIEATYANRRANPAASADTAYALARAAECAGYDAGVANALLAAGAAGCLASQLDTATTALDRAIAIFADLDDNKGRGRALRWRGRIFAHRAEYAQSLQCYRTALALFEELDCEADAADVRNFIGMLHYELGEYDRALEQYTHARLARERLGDVAGVAECVMNVGCVHGKRNDYPSALQSYTEALELGTRSRHHLLVAHGACNVGAAYFNLGNFEQASKYLTWSVDLSRELANPYGEASARMNLGEVYLHKHDFDAAVQEYEQALTLARAHGEVTLENEVLIMMGHTLGAAGRLEQARQVLSVALEMATKTGGQNLICEAHHALSRVHEVGGDHARALEHYKSFHTLQEEVRKTDADRRATVIDTLAELDRIEKETELRVLKAQLAPHFLFNALNSVSALMHDDVAKADRMLGRLGGLLRLAIAQSASRQVLLKEEIEFVIEYLALERMRFGERLVVSIDVHPDAESVSVPHLILQPLVENAVKHGLAGLVRPAHLQIGARLTGDMLYIAVLDDGVGLPNGWKLECSGVGLRNTARRLQHLFGERAALILSHAPAGGTIAELRIPRA